MKPLSAICLLLLSALAAHAQWELTTPIKTRSEFHHIHMVNDLVAYAADKPMGSIVRTVDGGHSWTRPYQNHFNDPMAVFMWDELRGIATGELGLVVRTDDGFATTTVTTTPGNGNYRTVFFLNDTLGWVGTETGKILRSTDGGASWELMESGLAASNYITDIQFLDPDTGYASCLSSRVIKSVDGGQTWAVVGPMDIQLVVHDIHFFDTQTGVGVGTTGNVIRTTDGGTTWEQVPPFTTYTMLDLAAQGDVLVACGANGRVMRSTDAGLTWTVQQLINAENRSVAMAPGGRVLLGTNGRFQASSDFGQTWTLVKEGTWHTVLNKVAFQNDQVGVAVGWQTNGGLESGLVRTADGGRTWSKAGNGGLGVHVTPDGSGCLGGGNGAFARTTDGFLTRSSANGPTIAIRCTWSFNATTHLVGGGHVNGGIYRTDNGGATWTRVIDDGNITINDIWFVNDMQGYAVGESSANYRTMDGGITWTPLPTVNGGHSVFFLNDTLGWTAFFRTTDGGDTWTHMGGTPQGTRSIFFTDPDTGYAVSGSGNTVKTTDGGITWTNVLPAILNAQIGDAAYVDGAIVAVSRFGDIYRAQVACPPVAAVPNVMQGAGTLCTDMPGSIQWYCNGDPLADGTTACIAATAPGAYHVVVTSALGCASAPSDVFTVECVPPATPVIEAGNGQLCTAAEGDLQWYFNGTPIDGGTTACIDADAPGEYHVVSADQYGCTSAPSDVFTVECVPPATPVIEAGDGQLCTAAEGDLQWYFNGTPIDGGTTACIDAGAPG
ncbi:MAG: YCF48-related protein, partial [Flavobacteriales bacterium]|nr:YCF48-related protein [Flavobacteriales bacterium]